MEDKPGMALSHLFRLHTSIHTCWWEAHKVHDGVLPNGLDVQDPGAGGGGRLLEGSEALKQR